MLDQWPSCEAVCDKKTPLLHKFFLYIVAITESSPYVRNTIDEYHLVPFGEETRPYVENLQTERAQRKSAGLKDAATTTGLFHHRQTSPRSRIAPWHRPPDQPAGPPAQDISACAKKQKLVFQKSYTPN